jgi:single-strand DNA-binding protein
MGENVAESFARGDRVMVVGSLKIRRVEGDDGTKKQFPEINVEEIGPTLRWATTTQAKNLKDDGPATQYPAKATVEPDF